MIYRIILSLIISVFVSANSFASNAYYCYSGNKKSGNLRVTIEKVDDAATDWGVTGDDDFQLCKPHNLEMAAIGPGKDVCGLENTNETCLINAARSNYGVMMMVAREINDHGVRLCTVVITSDRIAHATSDIGYYTPPEGEKCIWLCKDDAYGEKCQYTSDDVKDVKTCDGSLITRDSFDGYTMPTKSAASIYGGVLKLYRVENDDKCRCNGVYGMRHNMILAISNWTQTGHGAFVRPFNVTSGYKSYDVNTSWPAISATGKEILVCKNGYKPNDQGKDCEPINKERCAVTEADRLAMLCSTSWDATAYNSAEHTLKYIEDQDCYEYRCKQAGYAFRQGTHECEECVASLRGGQNPYTGECVKCDLGKIFNETAPGYCADTSAYTKSDLQYGSVGKNSVNYDKQCWTKVDTDEYKRCVAGLDNKPWAEKEMLMDKELLMEEANIMRR